MLGGGGEVVDGRPCLLSLAVRDNRELKPLDPIATNSE